ncbi:hemerythrin domain-containing protein [Vibrio sp. F74]|uniref:hemerythrin domain-containing protein n=1 Tax=Vibrio sp. F74 TaxID=700020 RepID=UPI0035F5A346
MSSIQNYMTEHHKTCDNLLVDAEGLLADKNWVGFSQAWQIFEQETVAHFTAEEEILFPAFEQKTGMTGGPTMVMRSEHSQVKGMFEQMNNAIQDKNLDRAMGIVESVMLLIQQHNMKEEQMLYPMTDMHLPNNDEVVSQMDSQLSTSRG